MRLPRGPSKRRGSRSATKPDATKWQKLLTFPAEHHPGGCERLVELTRMLPRDPVHAAHVAMLEFWLGFARRNAGRWFSWPNTTC